MKYKLINSVSKIETICDKIIMDGFDYYVGDAVCYPNNAVHSSVTNTIVRFTDPRYFSEGTYKKVIATNNPNIDLPKVMSEVEDLAFGLYPERKFWIGDSASGRLYDENLKERIHFIEGYNKSQETHPFSEDDMIEFLNWIRDNTVFDSAPKPYYRKTQTRLSQKELLQLWKEQQPKTVYYE